VWSLVWTSIPSLFLSCFLAKCLSFIYFKEVLLLVEAAELVGNKKPYILATTIHAYMSLCLCSGSGYPDNLPQTGPQAMF
jgi:hypothetical protein